jgi:hypothetical protein
MLTQEEKKMLLDLLNTVQVTGNRATIGKTLEKIDNLARKIEAMPVEKNTEVGVGNDTPKRKC